MKKQIFTVFIALSVIAMQTIAGNSSSTQLTQVVAVPANDFLNSIGVNSSINSRGEKVDTTLKTCQYIGARWIRTGPPDPDYVSSKNPWSQNTIECFKKLYEGGIRFSLMLPSSGDAHYDSEYKIQYPDGITYLKEGAKTIINEISPDALIAFEGCNEPNNWGITYNGQTGGGNGNSWRALARYHRDMYSAIQADPVLKNYPVWTLTCTGAENDNMGLQFISVPSDAMAVDAEFRGVTFADYANCHNYFVHPNWTPHSNNQTWLASDPTKDAKADHLYGNFGSTWYRHFAGHTDQELLTIPRVTTETGVTITQPYLWDWNNWRWTDNPDPDYSNPERRITEEYQALTYLSCYLAQFKQGWKYTAMYILRDRIDEGGNQTFGFYESHWVDEAIRYPSNPRLAAHYMHNFTTILADDQSIQTPGAVEYEIADRPATVHDLLLQKNDGKMMLIVWGEKYAYGAAPDNVTVNFGQTCSSIRVYNPAQYDPADPEKGTRPIQTEENVNAIVLSMLNHPYILEISGDFPEPEQYAISMENGVANLEKAVAGAIVTVTANTAPAGKVFDKWESEDVAFVNAKNETTTFIMPAKNVLAKATYMDVVNLPTIIVAGNITVVSQKGKIVISAENTKTGYSIYNITGQSVVDSATTGREEVFLPRGAYIVKVDNIVKKVFVM
ncbi:MAG: hypothetical protein LBH32_02865 [Dysgonamonadaceae bacterium]|jgi:hypothetical protein|nr:hypothetical protein [Dysgonamonadaceae bacterium]